MLVRKLVAVFVLVGKWLTMSVFGALNGDCHIWGTGKMTAKCRLLSVAVCVAWCTPTLVQADLVWEYLSTNGITTVSGQMTTSGNPGDVFIPGTQLSLVSFNTVFLNFVNITPASNWSSGNGPPFTMLPQGKIEVTVPGVAQVFYSGSGPVVPLFAANGSNSVQLGRPPGGVGGDTVVVFDPNTAPHAIFSPISTTFTTAIPEPSSFLCVGLIGCVVYAGSLGFKKLRHAV